MSPARVRFSCLKRLQKFSAKCCLNLKSTQPIKHHIMNLTRREDFVHVKLPINSLSQSYFKGELQLPVIFAEKRFRTKTSENSNLLNAKPGASLSPNISRFCLHQKSLPFASMTLMLKHRSYSSYLSDSTDISDWAADLTPCVQQLLDSNPFLVIAVGSTVIAWIVMPLILRKLHYSMQSSAAATLPYEKTYWVALEGPVRYLVTFVAFSHICVMIAPTSEALQHLAEFWKEAVILSFVWFLHQWKTNTFGHISSGQSLLGLGQDELLFLNKVSSVGLSVIGIMTLAEAWGIAVQSILTVSGIGGVVTAIATKDILGNVFSGLSMQFSEPFTVGDIIKAGTVEGEVVEMGLTTTSLLNSEKFPVVVPNSLFSSQAIVNKSRAEYCAITSKIPLGIGDLSKILRISDDIKSMLKTKEMVFLGKEAPYCYLSLIESSFAQLTIAYNIKYMSKDEMYGAEQDILLEVVDIIKKHGGELGHPWRHMSYQSE